MQGSSENCNHVFECIQFKGAFGEIELIRPLTSEHLETVQKNTVLVGKFCPNGAIRCRLCNKLISVDQQASIPTTAELLKKLKKLQSPKDDGTNSQALKSTRSPQRLQRPRS